MILEDINEANDIKKIKPEQYTQLADELREYIITNVARTGGHLSSSLGVVELTMALHLSLDLPKDKIIWDVGHQAYAHKILTGRKEQFKTLRCNGGLSGFPSRAESASDAFGAGHASTSLSAALGFVKARELKGTDETVVAVIGDGALTGGMAFEAINNASSLHSNMIIILNDNDMSISRNVGGLSRVFSKIRTDKKYNDLKYSLKNKLSKIPGYGDDMIDRIHKTKSSIKQFFVPGMIFEDFGITYLGPVDGHNIDKLVRMINLAKKVNHSVLIHVHTKKGKGYPYAERRPSFYHGVDPFDVESGELIYSTPIKTYSDIFSKEICYEAANDNKIVAITAAMADGCGLKKFEKKYPDRFFDVGIAEEHAVTFAAGLAAEGFKPYVSIYSSFLQRSFDQIMHDVCIQNLPVRFIVERAGIVGKDGITHQGIFDISYLNVIPNMTILAPKDANEFVGMLRFANSFDGPISIRIPRGAAQKYSSVFTPIEYSKSELIKEGKDIAIISVGTCIDIATKVADILKQESIDATIVNARFIKPLDTKMLDEMASKHNIIVTIEENVRTGGFGESVLNYYNDNNFDNTILIESLKDTFIEHGTPEALKSKYGLDPQAIAASIIQRIKR